MWAGTSLPLPVFITIRAINLICTYLYKQASQTVPLLFNHLTPNDPYSGLTTPLTSKCCILYIYSTNTSTEYFKHGIYSPFFLLKMQFVS